VQAQRFSTLPPKHTDGTGYVYITADVSQLQQDRSPLTFALTSLILYSQRVRQLAVLQQVVNPTATTLIQVAAANAIGGTVNATNH
jgi:hypothetical protein